MRSGAALREWDEACVFASNRNSISEMVKVNARTEHTANTESQNHLYSIAPFRR